MNYQDHTEAAADDGPDELAGAALHLRTANINPTTGLATDYLNHFNEAIMLLEMLPSGPEFRDDFLRWRPMSYCEHFGNSRFEARDAAITAYKGADPRLRTDLDALTNTMTAALETIRAALQTNPPPALARALAQSTVATLKPLVARAGALINGEAHPDNAQGIQDAVDDLMRA